MVLRTAHSERAHATTLVSRWEPEAVMRFGLNLLDILERRRLGGCSPHGAISLDAMAITPQLGISLEPHGAFNQAAQSLAAPERIRADHWDHSADVHAVAALMVALADGKQPWSSSWEALHARAPRCRALPRAVACVLFDAMAKRPDMRPQTPGELRSELNRAWTAHQIAHCALRVYDDKVDIDTIDPAPHRTHRPPVWWTTERVIAWGAAGVALCGLAGVAAGVALHGWLH